VKETSFVCEIVLLFEFVIEIVVFVVVQQEIQKIGVVVADSGVQERLARFRIGPKVNVIAMISQ